MSDRFLCLLTAAALGAALPTDSCAQAPRADTGVGGGRNRGAMAQPPLGTPMELPALPATPVAPGLPAVGNPASSIIDPSHRLQPGDQLNFKIDEDRDPAVPLQVSQTGEVVVEPLERPVKVSGMTTLQATAEIKRLLEKDYYHRATVRLALVAVNASFGAGAVSINGEVQRIGQIPIFQNKPLMLSEAIIQAGSFARFADKRRVRVTRKLPGGGTKTIVSDQKAVIEEGKLDQDLQLQPGDYIQVPTTFIKMGS